NTANENVPAPTPIRYDKQTLPFNHLLIQQHSYVQHISWRQLVSIASELDVLISIAIASDLYEGPTCRPLIMDTSSENEAPFIAAKNLGHPVPNMGGKSTLLRQVCLAVILAQVGADVPAESFKMSPVDHYELDEEILSDGKLSVSVLEYLVNKVQCRGLFSTHYHHLALDYQQIPKVSLYHMACRVGNGVGGLEKVTFLYKLTLGACPKSYGVNVAHLAVAGENVRHCCSNVSFVDNFVRDPNPISYDETPDSFQQPPRNCSKCGGLFGGLYCRQCTYERCKRNYTDEVCALCCYEVEKSFVNDSNPNSFIDSPNFFNQPPQHQYETYSCEFCGGNSHSGFDCQIGNTLVFDQGPCFNQDFDFNQPPHYSPSQPQTYSCELCGNDAHYGYDCPPKVPFISNPDPCYNFYKLHLIFNNNIFVVKTAGVLMRLFSFPVIRQSPQATSTEALQARENLMKSIQTFLKKFNRISFRETPKVLLLAWEKFFEIKHACKEKQHQPEDIQELLRKLLKDVQIISEELADYINIPNWNCPAFYHDDDEDDDEEYTIAITPVLPTEEPDNSLSMGDEHLSTIPEMESDKVIKSSVEDLVPIPSESEGIFDDTCDVPFCDNSPPLNVLNDHFEILSDFNDDCTLSDDDSFENIDYVEASPPDSELVSLEEVKDDILREKLLNIYLLIAKIESLNDNPTPDYVLKSPSTFPIPVEDSDSFFKKSDTSLSYSDNSVPEFETFSYHTEKTSSGSTTTHADNSLPEYDSFLFEIKPDQGELTSVVMEDILGELPGSEELADYINIQNWNCPAFYHDDDEDDDEEYTIAITLVLPTEEPDNSLTAKVADVPETKSLQG
ncbi:reverse transcriptase domain-containing protein, partial [Tanacetum coccineum]